MQENLNSASGRSDEEIRAENMAKYKEQIEREFAEQEDYQKRREKYGARKCVRLPITVEAYQWNNHLGQAPGLISTKSGWAVETFNGLVPVKEGDYIIRDIAGMYYPCNPQVFEQTYEVAD
jgi:hypothetical protein